MERIGVCLSCHKDVPTGSFAYRVLSGAESVLGRIPKTDDDHRALIGRVLYLAANVEVFGGVVAVLLACVLVVYLRRRKKR